MKEDIKGLIIFMYTVVCLVGIVGNGCVIYLVLSRRQMRSVTNYFIASLATSDMLMAIVCIPVTFIANVVLDYWPFPAAMCPLVTYLQVVIVFQNAYTLLAISLERYIAIMYPFKRRLTTCQCFLVIGLCWFLALATPLPTAITSRLEEFPGEEENETLSACYEQWPTENQRFTYSMTIMVLQYFVPLVVLTYTYARIVHVVWLKDAPPHGPLRPFARPVMMRQESARRMDSKTGKYTDPRKKVSSMS
nr:hypothetical protein BaRGS_024896 [Batillaria attramentaria]